MLESTDCHQDLLCVDEMCTDAWRILQGRVALPARVSRETSPTCHVSQVSGTHAECAHGSRGLRQWSDSGGAGRPQVRPRAQVTTPRRRE